MLQDPTLRNLLAISFGAIAGALSRYYITLWFIQRFGAGFPAGTFFINLTGCLAMGFFVTLTLERATAMPPEVKLLIATGFLGSYTTFSTYGLESVALLKNRNLFAAGVYWIGSALLGLVCIQLGVILARLGK